MLRPLACATIAITTLASFCVSASVSGCKNTADTIGCLRDPGLPKVSWSRESSTAYNDHVKLIQAYIQFEKEGGKNPIKLFESLAALWKTSPDAAFDLLSFETDNQKIIDYYHRKPSDQQDIMKEQLTARLVGSIAATGHQEIYPYVLSRWLAYQGNTRYYDPAKSSKLQKAVYDKIRPLTPHKDKVDRYQVTVPKAMAKSPAAVAMFKKKMGGNRGGPSLNSFKIDVYQFILANEHFNPGKHAQLNSDARLAFNEVLKNLHEEHWQELRGTYGPQKPVVWRQLRSAEKRFISHGPFSDDFFEIKACYDDACRLNQAQQQEIARLEAAIVTEGDAYTKRKNNAIAKAKKAKAQKQARAKQLATENRAAKSTFEARLAEFTPPTSSNLVVWNTAKGRPGISAPAEDLFAQLIYEWEQWFASKSAAQAFVPPEKGDFEKTEAYRSRVVQMEADHNAKNLAEVQELQKTRDDLFLAFVKRKLGKVTVHQIDYDADQEEFLVSIGTTSTTLFKARLAVPLGEAKERQDLLAASRINVAMIIDEKAGAVRIEQVYFVNENKVSPKQSFVYGGPVTGVEYRIDAGYIAQWHDRMIAEKQRQDAIAEEQLRHVKSAKQKEYARIRKGYGDAPGYLVQGTPVCVDWKSAMKASAIKRAGNNYVPYPNDCFFAPQEYFPLKSWKHMTGGTTLIQLGGRPVYTLSGGILVF